MQAADDASPQPQDETLAHEVAQIERIVAAAARGQQDDMDDRPGDVSLPGRLLHELRRREDAGFLFQERLKALNEITIALSRIDTFDSLCWHAVKYGIDQLGFDRLSLWFVDLDRRQMMGGYGVDEGGEVRDERGLRWSYPGTYIEDFIDGETEASLANDDAPIYNNRSEIIGHGWHISAPMLHGERFVGVLTADNYLRKQPMRSYEPELLRLYGITVGHLTELARIREQAFAMRLEQERTRVLRQFIRDVGHDFRTPLSVINTNSFILTRLEDQVRRQSFADQIREQVRYISRMLDSALEFVALDSDMVLNPTTMDLQTLLAELIAIHRTQSAAKNLIWMTDYDPSLTVKADMLFVRRALVCLLENAVQYTPEGGCIRVGSAFYSGEIGICIEDSGIGMAADAIDRIFEPMYRANQARTERRSGLGLSIARRIIEGHGGRIVVRSTPGKGSAFEVILPAQDQG